MAVFYLFAFVLSAMMSLINSLLPFVCLRARGVSVSARIAVLWLGFALVSIWQISETRHGIAALALLGIVFASRCSSPIDPKYREMRSAVSILMAVFGLLLVGRTLTSPHLHTALAIAACFVTYPVAYFTALRTPMPSARALFYMLVAPLLAALVAWALWNHFSGHYIFGPAGDANGFAAMMSVLLITAVGLAWLNAGLRPAAVVLAIPTAAALYLTESRSTLVALVVLCAAVLVFRAAGASASWCTRKKLTVFAAASLATVLLVSFGLKYVGQRLHHQEISLNGRVALLQSAVDIGLTQGPWVGEGVGTFTRFYPERRPVADQDSVGARAHSDYFELFADGGLLLALALLAVSAALWRAFALAWYRGPSMSAVVLSGAAYLALFAALNHTYINVFLSLIGGLLAGWGVRCSSRAENSRSLSPTFAKWLRAASMVPVALLTPALAISSIAELHVQAAVAPLSNPLWSPFRTEAGLRFLARTGVFPRVSFVYGLRAEMTLSQLPPGNPLRFATARAALDRYILAYQQDTRNSNYAYQIARLLANTKEFVERPNMEIWADQWFQTAVRLNKLNFAAALSYSRWLASRGRHEDALALLRDRARRVHRTALRQPLLDETKRISEAATQSSESATGGDKKTTEHVREEHSNKPAS